MALSPVRLRASMSVGSADTIAFTRSNSPALIASMKAALLEVVSGMPRFYRAAVVVALLVPRGRRPRAGRADAAAAASQERPPLGASFTVGRARRAAVERQSLLAARHGRSRRHRRPHRHRRPERRRRRPRRRARQHLDADDLSRRRRRHHEPERHRHAAAHARRRRWERVDVATGLMPIDVNAPGMAVTLVPPRPRRDVVRARSSSWVRRRC